MAAVNVMPECLLCKKPVYTMFTDAKEQLCFDCQQPVQSSKHSKEHPTMACPKCGDRLTGDKTICTPCRKASLKKPKRVCLRCSATLSKASVRHCDDCLEAMAKAAKPKRVKATGQVIMACASPLDSRSPGCSGKFLQVWEDQTQCEPCLWEIDQ